MEGESRKRIGITRARQLLLSCSSFSDKSESRLCMLKANHGIKISKKTKAFCGCCHWNWLHPATRQPLRHREKKA
jgi:hypothetical protein